MNVLFVAVFDSADRKALWRVMECGDILLIIRIVT